jgi:glycerophosphoryl diester phosphodiesterase
MRETGILSIVRRGPTSQVRYASFNPYDMDRLPYQCPDEGALVTLLHHFGINAWSLQQVAAALRKGEVAVLPVALSEAQLQAYFPPQRPPHVGMDAGDAGAQADPPRVTAPVRDVCRTRANASP